MNTEQFEMLLKELTIINDQIGSLKALTLWLGVPLWASMAYLKVVAHKK